MILSPPSLAKGSGKHSSFSNAITDVSAPLANIREQWPVPEEPLKDSEALDVLAVWEEVPECGCVVL